MKLFLSILACLAICPLTSHEIDPDTWFALYDEPYLTSMEILGHKYVVQIVEHDTQCECHRLPNQR